MADDDQTRKVNKYLDRAMADPMVIFLFTALAEAGCTLSRRDIVVTECPPSRAGGFAPEHGIVLCKNTIASKSHLQDTLGHELIHAYDHCTAKVDWNNPNMLACSEIRAQTLSGECKFTREFARGHPGAFVNLGIAKHFQECVKRRSILGVQQVFPDGKAAQNAVNTVWESCFPDTAPFDEIY